MNDLPFDIVVNILSYLPSACVRSFAASCKSCVLFQSRAGQACGPTRRRKSAVHGSSGSAIHGLARSGSGHRPARRWHRGKFSFPTCEFVFLATARSVPGVRSICIGPCAAWMPGAAIRRPSLHGRIHGVSNANAPNAGVIATYEPINL